MTIEKLGGDQPNSLHNQMRGAIKDGNVDFGRQFFMDPDPSGPTAWAPEVAPPPSQFENLMNADNSLHGEVEVF